MPQRIGTETPNVLKVDGEPVSGWGWHRDHWVSFTIDEHGEMTDLINCAADEERAIDYARLAANMRAGLRGKITLNDEE